MKTGTLSTLFCFLISISAFASEDPRLLQKLREARFSLSDAIGYAQKTSGPATSAKFEMDGNDLVFSVYTTPQGLEAPAEDADLSEIAGPATALPIQGKSEVFADSAHLKRASTHLTLMQLSRYSLTQVIQLALKTQDGMAYSVKNPTVRDHRALADVSILTADDTVVTVSVNLLTGKTLCRGIK
ncbi:MAG: hypothetical protein AABZ55_04585 [Bdellovibrionota bacterium]